MNKYVLIIFSLFISFNISLAHDFGFTENKGQWNKAIRYKANTHLGAVFITNNGMTMHLADMDKVHQQLHDSHSTDSVQINHHAYYISFVNAKSTTHFVTSQASSSYDNYYIGNDNSKWAANIHAFQTVVQQNIYTNIDVAYYGHNNGLKYEFIVHPNGNPKDIQLKIDGIQPYINEEGAIVYPTAFGNVVENKPVCYQVIEGDTVTIPSKFILQDNILSIQLLEHYNLDYPLVLDPELVFSTYSGSVNENFYAFSTTFDYLGNVYAAGIGFGLGWPVDTGAFQTNFAYNVDAVIIKYNQTGSNKLMATYYGGFGADVPMSIAINNNLDIAIGGFTQSTDLPMLSNSFDTTNGNNVLNYGDIFVVTLNSAGTQLLGASYIGGAESEVNMTYQANNTNNRITNSQICPLHLQFDSTGQNLWVVSNTSSADFPITPNAFQNTYGGNIDGVIFKIDKACSNLIFSSYLGGNELDFPTYFQLDGNQKLVGTMMTKSSNLPTFSNSYNSINNGNQDGYVFNFNLNTLQLTNSCYLGSTLIDGAVKVAIHPINSNIYVLGITNGNYPVSNNSYVHTGGNMFIHILNNTLSSSIASTRLGPNSGTFPPLLPTAFGINKCNHVIVAGIKNFSAPTLTMPVSNNAYQSQAGSFWFGSLTYDLSTLNYATYLGHPNLDHIHAGQHSIDESGNLYHSICSTNGNFPITPNVWSPSKQNGNQLDIITFKFKMLDLATDADFELAAGYKAKGCGPLTVKFNNLSTSVDTFTWYFGNGDSSNILNPTYTYTQPGIYQVLLVTKEFTCNTTDFHIMTITVDSFITPSIITIDTLLCTYPDTIYYTGAQISNWHTNMKITWEPANFIWGPNEQDSIWVKPKLHTKYTITVESKYDTVCIEKKEAVLNINARDSINADFNVQDWGCAPYSAYFSNTSLNTNRYEWNFGDGNTSNIENPTHIYTQPGTYLVKFTAYDDTCNLVKEKDTLITVLPTIDPFLTTKDTFLCNTDNLILLEAQLQPNDPSIHLSWSPSNAINAGQGSNIIWANPAISNIFTITAYNNDPKACVITKTADIFIHLPQPASFKIQPDSALICLGDSIVITASGGKNYLWDKNPSMYQLSDSSIVAKPTFANTYFVKIVDDSNCIHERDAYITVQVPTIVDAGPDQIVKYGETVRLHGQSPDGYYWYPTHHFDKNYIFNPLVKPSETTTYYLRSNHENFCNNIDSITIYVTNVKVPNAFSPNGDGLNDKLHVLIFKDNVVLDIFRIYNRYGNLVFETDNLQEGWDGNYKNEPSDVGVYFYYVDYYIGDKKYKEKGDVTLLR